MVLALQRSLPSCWVKNLNNSNRYLIYNYPEPNDTYYHSALFFHIKLSKKAVPLQRKKHYLKMILKNLYNGLLLIACTLFLAACSDVRINEHKDWKEVFDKYGIEEGAFEYYDNNKEIANYYNKELCSSRLSPASTFKIFASLVALETSVALDEQMIIKYDGQPKYYRKGRLLAPGEDTTDAFNLPDWNKDLTMAEAFKLSAVPYYQEIARRIGATTMQQYLDTVQYGNAKIGPTIDDFWLNDTLKITPDEQVGFMKRLYHDELPFSPRSQRIVKGMMLQESEQDYKLYYKTGWGSDAATDMDIVWVVGFAETIHRLKNPKTEKIEAVPHPYFFALCFKVKRGTPDIVQKRQAILQELLTKAGIHQYAVK